MTSKPRYVLVSLGFQVPEDWGSDTVSQLVEPLIRDRLREHDIELELVAIESVEEYEPEVGDVVQLKSGGPAMTVISTHPPTVTYHIDGDELRQATIPATALRRLSLPGPPPESDIECGDLVELKTGGAIMVAGPVTQEAGSGRPGSPCCVMSRHAFGMTPWLDHRMLVKHEPTRSRDLPDHVGGGFDEE